jgi:hypothetical protein
VDAVRWQIPGLGKIGKIAMRPPRPEPGRHGLAIVLIAKNEARHVGEWAEFHARAGARAFFVYDDGSTDATVPILRETLGAALTVTPWAQRLSDAALGREIHNQMLAYAHAASNFGAAFRWMTFIDVDEFLVPRRAATLPEALGHLEGCRNISLPWHMFGHCGHKTPPAGGIVRNYLFRAADPMSDARGVRAFKCIVDPCHLTAVKVHSMETDDGDRTCNDRGAAVRLADRDKPGFYSADNIQLNHYYARSEQELEEKVGRGHFVTAMQPRYAHKIRRTIANVEKAVVEDRAAVDYLARIEG